MSTKFEEMIPITKPTLPNIEEIIPKISEIFSTRMVTNHKYVREFEEKIAEYLDVDYAVAVSSCTAGMMLVIKSLGLKGNVILPSFTFHATAHALSWNGLKLRFADINPETLTIDVNKVQEIISPETSAICGVHTFGNPCDIKALEEIAEDNNIKLYFDAAHAFGSTYNNKHVGYFGDAEIFSLSPTKLLVAGEGGIVTTNDAELKRKLVIGRNYGDDGSYDCEFAGINARMGEFNAILGLGSLKNIEQNIMSRHQNVSIYKSLLSEIPGVSFQKIEPKSRTTYKDFSININPDLFGLNRDELSQRLFDKNIVTKKYFYPPVHRQRFYSNDGMQFDKDLPETNRIAQNVLSLPLWSDMDESLVKEICSKIREEV
jgi:dTDP-4-amino-4,6-dideoxygalactose transaminase